MLKISKSILAIATLSGTIIGAGLFSLPYIASKVGIWVMLGYFLILGALAVLIHLFFGELASITPDFKRLPGFAKIHLGNWGEKAAFISTILGLLGTILAYLIIGGEFLTNLLSPIFGGDNLIYTLFYFTSGAILIFFGIKAISRIEFWGLILFFIVLVILFFKGLPILKIDNLLRETGNITNLFLPYGPILFSLWGAALIPEVEEMLGEDKKLLKKIILVSILIPIMVYLFFIFLILGICGPRTTEAALTGLGNFLGTGIVSLALFFGVLCTFTSFIALGLTLKKVFWYDLKIKKNLAWAITCFIPLILFLIGMKHFIPAISVVGGVMLGIDGILILLMYHKLQAKTQKSKVKSLLIIFPLAAVLLGGIIYEMIYFIK